LSTIFKAEVSDTRLDIYDHEKRFKNAKTNLELCKKTPAFNKESILDFVQHLLTCGVSKARATKYLLHLHTLSARASLIKTGPGHKLERDASVIRELVSWVSSEHRLGVHGAP
jgi:hypothetical protein